MADVENAPAGAPAKPAKTKAAASPIIPKALAGLVSGGSEHYMGITEGSSPF